MTRILISAFIVFATAFSVLGSEPKISKASATSDEQKIVALNQEWADAEVRQDEAVLQRILDDRFLVTDGQGKTIDKAAFIDAVRHFSMVSQIIGDQIIHLYDNTAVVVGTATIQFSGSAELRQLRYTTTYVKRQGMWRAIAEQYRVLPLAAK